ncbi:3-keto-5-aminohexanoate cleavage protein [Seonamhaeicola sp. ML3]|uniref:3-keto-5-aminohexanoate cleavage protein n=1 Tax=Seonamhaeicola sp. ML3 TaxID=2937786 RepID=UPI002113458A|nr:3-keto-5-aminohexanoate cleavage protein [Seonamhaeicola sp. ML3]
MNNNFILNFTPTGMIPTKEMTEHVPLSVEEIVEDVHRANEIGITMVHLHARDEVGVPTYKQDIYSKIVEGIRKYAPELVLCISLSGRNFGELEKRSEPLMMEGVLKPDMGSLTLSSLNFNRTASVNSPDMVQSLARIMKEKGVVPELEAFDIGMINYAKYLERKGLLEPPYYFNLLFGNIACSQANLLHAGVMINDLPKESYWSLAGIGNEQLKMNSLSLAFGGGVRVGLEDNIWFDTNRTRLATNSELLERVHFIAEANGRDLMTAKEFREHLNLAPGNGLYGRINS